MERLDAVDADRILSDLSSMSLNAFETIVIAILGDYERGITSYQKNIEDVRDALREAFAELEARAMPEGFEWPRYENGEQVRFGDEVADSFGGRFEEPVVSIEFFENGFTLYGGRSQRFYGYEERVERFSPKVLDACGEQIKEGDAVYVEGIDEPLTVRGFAGDGRVLMDFHGDDSLGYKPSRLTHRRPVPDADGAPCRIGDEVWDIHIGEHQVIEDIMGTCGGYETLVVRLDSGERTTCDAVRVSHRKPVLDAAGVPIKVCDTVWTDYGDGPWTVTKITTAHAWHVYGHSDELGSLDMQPNLLTHRAPVLAADGEPLEAGQTVYAKNYGYVKCTVLTIEWVVDGYLVEVENEGGHKFRQTPDEFTHQRPVLDAEGNRIEPAMDVWWVCEGDERGIHAEKLHVESIGEDGFVTCNPFNYGTWVELEPSELYVHKPVLAADGKPLREGETVYKVGGDGTAYVFDGMSDNIDGLAMLHHDGKPYIGTGLRVDQLTHERPDSWERLEEDAGKNPFDYCKDVGHRLDTCENSEAYKARDLVRRARALAKSDAS